MLFLYLYYSNISMFLIVKIDWLNYSKKLFNKQVNYMVYYQQIGVAIGSQLSPTIGTTSFYVGIL